MTNEQAVKLSRWAVANNVGVRAVPTQAGGRWSVYVTLELSKKPGLIVDEFTRTAVQSTIEALWESQYPTIEEKRKLCQDVLTRQSEMTLQEP